MLSPSVKVMTSPVRVVVASHLIIFVAGIALGKSWDNDELSMYREAHESWLTKIRRKSKWLLVGVGGLTTFILVTRAVTVKKI